MAQAVVRRGVIAGPLFWADGITRADELEAYADTGLNTVVVRLFWQPSPDGSLNPDDLAPQRAFAEAAAARGLKVIYALPAAPAGMEAGFRVSASSKAYFDVWATWVGGAMERLKGTPNLIGWALPDDPRDLPFADEVGWQRWLRENYASPAILASQWKASFASFDDASLQGVEEMLDAYRGRPLSAEDATPERIAELQARPPIAGDPSWLFHPASLALAQYKWEAYRALLAAWAEVIRGNDEERPIFSGRLPDYAQLLSLPPQISVSVPDLMPGVAEADALTHNPQAIAMARRGGRFKAIPTLLTRASGAVGAEFLPSLTPRWIESALVNGASGVSFAFWPDLLQNEALRASIARSLARWRPAEWGRAPISTAAVLMAPLADGVTLQVGRSLPARPRGLYGFGEQMVLNEPSDLAYSLRWGTAFGSVDFLSVDDLSPDGSTLARYSTVLAPCALSLSQEQTGALANFVRGGGVLVADMGAGAVQAGGSVSSMPPALASLLGVAPQMITRRTSFNLSLLEPNPLLPTWSRLHTGRQNTPLTGGRGQGATFAGLTGYPVPLSGARQVALADQWLQPINNGNVRIVRSALLASSLGGPGGGGTVFYAPWQLWGTWRPGQSGFDAFHGDLLARNAALAAGGAPSLVPQPVGEAAPLWAPVVNYADGIALFNPTPGSAPALSRPSAPSSTQSSALARSRPPSPPASTSEGTRTAANPYGSQPTAPRPVPARPELPEEEEVPNGLTPGTLAASVQTAGVGDFAWSEALALFDPSAPFTVVGGRPAPVANPDEWEGRAHPVTLQVLVAPGESKLARLIPVRAQNLAGGPLLVHGARYDEEGIKVSAWPNTREVSVSRGEYSISLTEPAPTRLTFHSGLYPIAPRSRHRVTLTLTAPAPAAPAPSPGSRRRGEAAPAPAASTVIVPRTRTQILTADENGRFTVEATGTSLTVEVAPA